MIKGIAEETCVSCGLCENVCPMDVFRRKDGQVYIAYQQDCSACMQCLYVCPVDAIDMRPGIPKKYDGRYRWKRIKELLGAGPKIFPR